MKASESEHMHGLEKGVTTTVNVHITFVSIFSRIVLVQIFKCTGLIYNGFADDLLKYAVTRSGSKHIDIVFDVHYENSIKNDERGNHSTGKLQFKAIVGLSQIKQWGSFQMKTIKQSFLDF